MAGCISSIFRQQTLVYFPGRSSAGGESSADAIVEICCIPPCRKRPGVANIEGLAYGIPVVSTNVGNPGSFWATGPTAGWQPGDPESLAGTIRDYIENPVCAGKKSVAGRRFLEER